MTPHAWQILESIRDDLDDDLVGVVKGESLYVFSKDIAAYSILRISGDLSYVVYEGYREHKICRLADPNLGAKVSQRVKQDMRDGM
jgi:hypothetical protein